MLLGMPDAAVDVSTGTKKQVEPRKKKWRTDDGAIGQEPPGGQQAVVCLYAAVVRCGIF